MEPGVSMSNELRVGRVHYGADTARGLRHGLDNGNLLAMQALTSVDLPTLGLPTSASPS